MTSSLMRCILLCRTLDLLHPLRKHSTPASERDHDKEGPSCRGFMVERERTQGLKNSASDPHKPKPKTEARNCETQSSFKI